VSTRDDVEALLDAIEDAHAQIRAAWLHLSYRVYAGLLRLYYRAVVLATRYLIPR
jgi:hypothetical protein